MLNSESETSRKIIFLRPDYCSRIEKHSTNSSESGIKSHYKDSNLKESNLICDSPMKKSEKIESLV